MSSVPEIRREKVFIPSEMTTKEIKRKYGLPSERAWVTRGKGFFVKNYSQKQVIIDPENFDPSILKTKTEYPFEARVEAKPGEKDIMFSGSMMQED